MLNMAPLTMLNMTNFTINNVNDGTINNVNDGSGIINIVKHEFINNVNGES